MSGLAPGLERFQLPDLSEPQPVVALLELLDEPCMLSAMCPCCGSALEMETKI